MRLSRKAQYAVRALVALSLHSEGRPVPLKEIARREVTESKYNFVSKEPSPARQSDSRDAARHRRRTRNRCGPHAGHLCRCKEHGRERHEEPTPIHDRRWRHRGDRHRRRDRRRTPARPAFPRHAGQEPGGASVHIHIHIHIHVHARSHA